MAANFTVKFLVNRTSGTYQIQLTDTSSGFTFSKANFKITYPNGIVVENTDFNSPDISSAGGTTNKDIKFDVNNKVLTGTYTIVINAKDSSNNDHTATKSFNFVWKEPVPDISNTSDVLTPLVKFKDNTSGYDVGNFTETINTRTLSSSFPSSSAVSGASAISNTGTSNFGSLEINMINSNNYYEGDYTPSLSIDVTYAHTADTYLSVQYIKSYSETISIKRAPTQNELLEKINQYKDDIDTYKNTNPAVFARLSEQYDLVIGLYSHIIDRTNAALTAGSEASLRELLDIVEPNASHTFQSSPINQFTTSDTESTQDIIGGMVETNTENGISVTYNDTTAKLNFDVADFTITQTGDTTGTVTVTNLANATLNSTLATVNSTTGAFGSTTAIPVITVNGKGLITNVQTAAISTVLTLAADSGSNDNVTIGTDTLTIAGGTGLTTTISNNNISVAIDSTVATLTGSQTLTNKTIDADNNTVSNIEVDNLKSGVLDTDLSSVAGTDTTLASAKAIKSYVDAQILTKDNTDEITEGSSNLYFTNERVDDRVNALLQAGSNVSLSYDDAANTLTISSTQLTNEQVQDVIGGMLGGDETGGISVTYDDTNNEIDFALSSIPNSSLTNSTITVNGTSIALGASGTLDTGDIGEGSNLYFTNERVDDRVNALLQAGSNVSLTYDDAANTLTIAATQLTNEEVQDIIGGMLGGDETGGISVTYDDTNNEIDFTISNVPNSSLANSSVTINGTAVSLGGSITLDTDDIGEGSTNQYFTNARARGAISENSTQLSYDSSTGVLTFTQGDTDTVSEGTGNLYFTNERVDDRVSSLIQNGTGISWSYDDAANTFTPTISLSSFDTGDLSEGSNLYYTAARFNTAFAGKSTSDLSEGTNLYYTDERVDDRVSNLLTAGSNISLTYDDAAGTLTIASTQLTSEQVEDIVGAMVDGGTETFITVSYDDTNGKLNFVVPVLDEDNLVSNSATSLATQQSIKAYVDAEVAGLVDSAPSTLDTLNELAAALGDDANFSTTTSTALGNRLRVDVNTQGLTSTQQGNALTNLGITATLTELNYVDGVTSSIQTQLDSKLSSESDTLDSVTGRGATTTNAITTGDVTISSATPELFFLDTDNNVDAKFIANNGNLGIFADTNNEHSSSTIYFNIDGSEKARFTSGGKLGIGTGSSLDEKLHVQGSVNNDDIAIKIENTFDDDGASSAPASALLFAAASNNGYIRLTGSPSDDATQHKFEIGSTASGSFITFKPSGSTALTLDSSQNATFAGNVTVSGTYPKIILTDTDNNPDFTIIGGNGQFGIYDETNSTYRLHIASDGTIKFNSYGAGYLKTDANGVISVDSDIIEDTLDSVTDRGATTTNAITTGDVEIVGDLTIDGDGASNAEITSSTASSIVSLNVGGFTGTPSLARDVRFFTNNASGSRTERMRLDSSGNLAIGDTSASAKLDVNAGTSDTIAVFESTDSRGRIQIGDDDTNVYVIAEDTKMSLGTSNTLSSTNLTIDSSGKAGINYTTPSAKLHIETGADQGIRIHRTGTNANFGAIEFRNSDDSATNGRIGFNTDQIRIDGTDEILFINDGSESARFDENGNLGIGTSSPSSKLHIKYTGTGDGLTLESSDAGASASPDLVLYRNSSSPADADQIGNIFFRGKDDAGNDTNYALILGAINDASNNTEDGNLFFRTTAVGSLANRLSIVGDKIGIGTDSPSDEVHISNSTNATTTLQIQNANTGTGARANLHLQSDASRIDLYATSSTYDGVASWTDAGVVNTSTTSSGGLILNSQAGGIKFQTSTNERMRISSAGLVGIGTDSPDSLLHIESTANTSTPILTIENDNAIKMTLGVVRSAAGTSPDTSFIAYDGSLRFIPGSGSATEKLTLDSSGNATFASTVTAGTYKTSGSLTGIVITGQEIYANEDYNGNDGAIRLNRFGYQGGQTKFRDVVIYDGKGTIVAKVDGSEGRVGIGVTSPTAKLHVQNNVVSEPLALFQTITAGDASVRIEGIGGESYLEIASTHPTTGDTSNSWGIGMDDNTSLSFGWGTNNTLNKSHHLTITNTGSVGIGTSSPAEKLHIQGSANGNVKALIENTNTGTNAYATLGFQSDQNHSVQPALFLNGANNTNYAGANSLNMYQHGNFPLGFVTNNLLRMTVAGDGNVGIGTTSPGNPLHIYKNATIGGITSTTVANAGLRIQDAGANMYVDGNSFVIDTAGYLTTTGSSDFDIGTNSTSRIKIKGDGKVGIGTAAPYKKLEVTGDIQLDGTDANIWIKSGAAGTNGFINWTFNTNDTVYNKVGIDYDTRATTGFHIDAGYPITIDATTRINFAIAGSNQGAWDSTGLGIGTESPATPLHVDGGSNTLVGKVVSSSSTRTEFALDNTSTNNVRLGLKSTPTGVIIDSTNHSGSTKQPMLFQMGGGTHMTMGTDGYIGMGIADTNNQRLTLAEADANGSHIKMNNSRTGGGYWVVGVGDSGSSSSIVDAGGLFFYNGTTKLKLDSSGNATFAGDLTVSGGDITLGTDVYAKKIYRSTATISSSSYTTVATVAGDNLSSAVRMVVTGTSGNVVMANIAEIIVNHSTDILIKTTNSFYRKLFIKVVSNGNEDFAIELKRDGDTNNTTIQIEIEPLGNETVTFTNSHSFSTSTLEHESLYGETTSSNDTAGNHFHKNMLDYQKIKLGNSADLELYHDGSNSIIDNDTGDLIIRSDSDDIKILAQDDIVIRDNDDSTNMARFINGGAVELYHNGSKKFDTTANGVNIHDSELGFAEGHGTASPGTAVIFAPYGAGTNIGGGEMQFYGGRSTGTAAGGSIKFYTSPTGSSGSSANAHVQALSIDSSQNATFAGDVTATSFSGDGSNLTGVTGEWDGTLTGNAEITGNLQIIGSSGDTLTLTKSTTEPSLRIEGDTNKDFVITVSGELLTFTQNDGATDILTLDHDTKNATFGGKIIAGDSGGTNGSVLLQQTYSGDDIISTIGTMYSSGGLILGYGIAPKNGSSGFISTADNANFQRAYMLLDNNEFTIGYAAAQTTTVGSDITGLTTPFTLDITTGNATFGGNISLADGWTLQNVSGGYAKFSSWVNVSNTGLYTTEDMYFDLDDSSSRFVVRGVSNAELFEIDTSDSNNATFAGSVTINGNNGLTVDDTVKIPLAVNVLGTVQNFTKGGSTGPSGQGIVQYRNFRDYPTSDDNSKVLDIAATSGVLGQTSHAASYIRFSTAEADTDTTEALLLGPDNAATFAGNITAGSTSLTASNNYVLDVKKAYSSGNGHVAYFGAGTNTAAKTNFDTVVVAQDDVPCLAIIEGNDANTASTQQALRLAVGDNNAVISASNTSGGLLFFVDRATTATGFATNSGTRALHLLNNGNANFAGSIRAHSNVTVHSSSNAPYIDFVENADLADSKARITMDQIDTNNGTLIFSTEGSGTLSERMRITSGGNVGIGTNSPAAKLEVQKDGFNGSNGLADYNIVGVASGSHQATIGAVNTGDAYANLNLFTTVGSSQIGYHISKRPSNSTDLGGAHGLDFWYFNGSGFSNIIGFTATGGATFAGTLDVNGASASTFYALQLARSGSGTADPDIWGENNTFVIGTSASTEVISLSGTNATFASSVHLDNDSAQLQFGDDNDMQIYHNGAVGEINNATGQFTIDSAGQVNIDSGNAEIHLRGSGTTFGKLFTSGGNFYVNHPTADKDIIFSGNDGGSSVTALTLDMSEGGNATFAGQVLCDTNTTSPSTGDAAFYKSSAGAVLSGFQAILETGSAGSRATALTIDNSQNATFAGNINSFGTTNTYSSVLGRHPVHTAYGGLWNTKGQANETARYLILNAADADGYRTYINGDELYLRAGVNSTTGQVVVRTTGTTFSGDVTIGDTSSEHRTLTLQTNSEKDSVINLKEGSANYGFSIGYYGVANDFIIKRHDNSASGTDVFTLFRENSNASFAGIVDLGNSGDIDMSSLSAGQFKVKGSGYTGAIALNGSAMHIYHNSSVRDLILGTNETARLTIAGNSGNTSITGTFTAAGDVVAFSDERLKSNIETLDGSKVYDMRGVSFTKDDKESSGVIAQELEKVAPELVNNDSEYKSVAYGNITGYLIEAIKDLKAEVEDLKKQLKNK